MPLSFQGFRAHQEMPLNTLSRVSLCLLAALALPAALAAQDAPPVDPPTEDAPPADLAATELARSHSCVPVLTRLAALESELAPLAERAQRIGTLNQAVGLEDRERVLPLDPGDPLEAAVDRWFERDAELAEAYAEREDETLLEERNRAREQIRTTLREAFEAVTADAEARMDAEGELGAAALACDGAILVRSAVLEACEETSGPVCDEARNREEMGSYRFVDSAEDLWDVEQLRTWSNPSPLGPSPEGGLGGAQTGTMVRRGNVTLVMSLEPLIQDRTGIPEEEAAEFDAHLEALGFQFDDPRFVMTPALAISLDMIGPLGGETHYLLHFEDLSDPSTQVFWTVPAIGNGPTRDIFPAPGWVLARLAEGEEVRLTAVHVQDAEGLEEEGIEAEAIFTLELTSVGQIPAVGTLLSYMASGDLASDLARLVPPDSAGRR
jgi:hypothetical protein